jgi:proton glutamate symport protein
VSLTTKVLLALVAGLAVGMVITSSTNPALLALPGILEPLGTIWVNALRMTVVPLVVTSVIIGVNSVPDARTIGRIGARALGLVLVILAIAATFATLAGRFAMSFLAIDAGASAALRASAAASTGTALQGAQKIVSIGQWLVELVPSNPVKAMADGTMLPLIVFTVLFGLAITNIADDGRTALLRVLKGIYDASLMVMHWVMILAPIGVFALTIPLAQRLGLAAAGVHPRAVCGSLGGGKERPAHVCPGVRASASGCPQRAFLARDLARDGRGRGHRASPSARGALVLSSTCRRNVQGRQRRDDSHRRAVHGAPLWR